MAESANGSAGGAPLNTQIQRASAAKRRREFVERFLDASDRDSDVAEIRNTILAAMRDASLSVRVADASTKFGFSYDFIPDHPVRLQAARLLAEIWGLVGAGRDAISVNIESAQVNVTVDQRIGELEALGIPRAELLRELRQVVESAESAEPRPAKAATLELSE